MRTAASIPASASTCVGSIEGFQAAPNRNGTSIGASTISRASSGKMIAACTRAARSCTARNFSRSVGARVDGVGDLHHHAAELVLVDDAEVERAAVDARLLPPTGAPRGSRSRRCGTAPPPDPPARRAARSRRLARWRAATSVATGRGRREQQQRAERRSVPARRSRSRAAPSPATASADRDDAARRPALIMSITLVLPEVELAPQRRSRDAAERRDQEDRGDQLDQRRRLARRTAASTTGAVRADASALSTAPPTMP